MNPMGFLKPGIKIKRWLILGLLGILLLGIGLSGVLIRLGFEPDSGLTAAAAIAGGALALYVALRRLVGLPPALGAVKGLSSGARKAIKG